MKRLNLVAGELNRIHENSEGIALIGEQEGKKRFTLKTPFSIRKSFNHGVLKVLFSNSLYT